MSLTPKPYNEDSKLVRRVYGGRPQITSSLDLNQSFEGISTAFVRLSQLVGMLRDNWVINQKLKIDSVSGNNNVFKSEINLIKINSSLPAYVYFKGVRFTIPVGTEINYTGNFTVAKPKYPVGYVVLVATKHTITFAENPVVAGISSTEEPTNVPSSDAIVYRDERLVYTADPINVALAAGEENIGIIASVTTQDVSTIDSITTDGVTSLVLNQKTERQIVYNAITPSDIATFYSLEVSDSLLTPLGTPFVEKVGTPQNDLNNNTVSDVLVFQKQWLDRKFRYINLITDFLNKKASGISSSVDDLQAQINELKNQIAALTAGTANVPIGGIVAYFGNLDNFENNGAGKAQTGMAIWAVCNGLNNTPDLRGRFLVGAIDQVPASGAPPLKNEVNPTASNSNPFSGYVLNYKMGDAGGEPAHKLVLAEIPKHKHKYNEPVLQNNSDSGGTPDYVARNQNGQTDEQGGDQLHNNIPPYFALVYLMRYK